jgi:type I protein arginine methyltransferase
MEFVSTVSEEEIKDAAQEVFPMEKVTDAEEDLELEQAEKDLSDWDDDEETTIKSLFNNDTLSSVDELISHDVALFNFDIKSVVAANGFSDDFSIIKMINFIRTRVNALNGESCPDATFIESLKLDIASRSFLENDEYMKPVIEDDPLLFLYENEILQSAVDEEDN